jgi:hypothetical protein
MESKQIIDPDILAQIDAATKMPESTEEERQAKLAANDKVTKYEYRNQYNMWNQKIKHHICATSDIIQHAKALYEAAQIQHAEAKKNMAIELAPLYKAVECFQTASVIRDRLSKLSSLKRIEEKASNRIANAKKRDLEHSLAVVQESGYVTQERSTLTEPIIEPPQAAPGCDAGEIDFTKKTPKKQGSNPRPSKKPRIQDNCDDTLSTTTDIPAVME